MSDSMEQRLRMLRRSLKQGDLAAASALLNGPARPAAGAGAAEDAAAGAREEPGAATPTRAIGVGPAAGPGPTSPFARARPMAPAPAFAKAVPLAVACEGVEIPAARGSKYWLIRRSLGGPPLAAGESLGQPAALAVVEADGSRLATLPRKYAAILGGARQRWDELEASAALCKAADGAPEDLLFMDIESCGLSPAPVFLIGMMTYSRGSFAFEQLLARDYSEERAILEAFARRLPQAEVLVTFNGKSFDMNMLRQRSAFHGVEMPGRLAHHLDLLHESRKRWKRSLPNCRLQTLETCLCGRRRVGDIPGAQIAEAYHSFVRSGDARLIGTIVHHNLLDLLTMGELVCHLLSGVAPD